MTKSAPKDEDDKYARAGDLTTSMEDLTVLSRDSDPRVRRAVARNLATAPQVLKSLSRDEHPWVRRAAGANPNTPVDVVIVVSRESGASEVTWLRAVRAQYEDTSCLDQ
jgi:hypothetical protein